MPAETGIYARLRFMVGDAVRNMTTASRKFEQLHQKARMMRAGARDVATGMRQLAIAGVGAGVAVAGIARVGIKFDEAMSGVRAVTFATEEDFSRLRAMAMQLGATTTFTATQAAQAMESLSRASFTTSETLEAIPVVLAAAEAESMDLATAAGIVADNVRAFSLQAADAGRVADTLAYVSAKANTNMVGLGEALSYVALDAKQARFNIEQTAGALGIMANVGVKGSSAGTALRMMLTKLAKPSEKAMELMGGKRGFAAAIQDSAGRMRPLTDILANFIRRMNRMKTDMDKAAFAAEIFGIRGGRAFKALKGADIDKVVVQLADVEANAAGSAAKMADIRRQNFAGELKLLKSAAEGAAIGFWDLLKPMASPLVGRAADFLSGVAASFTYLGTEASKRTPEMKAAYDKASDSARGFALGVREGIQELKEWWKALKNTILKPLGISMDTMQSTVKTAVVLIGKVVTIAPAIIALGAGMKVLGMAMTLGRGAGRLLMGGLGAGRVLLGGAGAARAVGGLAAAGAGAGGAGGLAPIAAALITNPAVVAAMGGAVTMLVAKGLFDDAVEEQRRRITKPLKEKAEAEISKAGGLAALGEKLRVVMAEPTTRKEAEKILARVGKRGGISEATAIRLIDELYKGTQAYHDTGEALTVAIAKMTQENRDALESIAEQIALARERMKVAGPAQFRTYAAVLGDLEAEFSARAGRTIQPGDIARLRRLTQSMRSRGE
jgi:TP901 family phage tail tape measure protein